VDPASFNVDPADPGRYRRNGIDEMFQQARPPSAGVPANIVREVISRGRSQTFAAIPTGSEHKHCRHPDRREAEWRDLQLNSGREFT
jgi:hypothetical protein